MFDMAPHECCIYIAFYCLLLYNQSALQSCGGGGLSSTTTSVQHPLGWCDSCHRTPAPVRSPHTSYRWRGERVNKPNTWKGIIRSPWLTRASGGNLARTPGLHPYSFTRSAMGFLMTTESQNLSLTSHLKDGAFFDSIVSPSFTGELGPTKTAGWAPPAGLTNTSSSSNLVFPGCLQSRYWPGSTLLSFSGEPVLGCRVIWLAAWKRNLMAKNSLRIWEFKLLLSTKMG